MLVYQTNPGSGDNKIKAQTFTDKNFSGETVKVGDSVTVEITGRNPSVVSDNNGAPVIVYNNNDNDTVYAKRFDPTLKALGSALQLSEGDNSTNPDVCALSDGSFLVCFKG